VLPSAREPDQDHALELLRAAQKGRVLLKAPALWLYETGNLLGRTVPDLSRAQGRGHVKLLNRWSA
jgi:hypothetical protein